MSDEKQTQDQAAQGWAATAGQHLRDAEQQVPSDVQLKLQAARRAAVMAAEQADQQAQTLSPWYAFGASSGVLAAAAVVIVLMSNPAMMELPNLNEQELAAAQEVELLEDLEFVAWMLAMEETDETPNQG